MHNALLDVSAKALQKNLEKEANFHNRAEFGNLEAAVAEKAPVPSSIFQRLLQWVGGMKVHNTQVAAPKLKNKGI